MQISEIKSSLPIAIVLSQYSLLPDKNNRICCPFHPDKTPSMQIYPKTNTWTCFSKNCDAGSGDVIEFIQRMDKSSKREAIMRAKSLINQGTVISTQIAILTPDENLDLTNLFHGLRLKLHRSKKALDYLKSRSIDPQLEIGYNPYGTEYKQLQNCIVFPLKDSKGQIVSLYGRSISESKSSTHFYTKNRKGLYPGYPLSHTKTIYVTEAIVDAATLQTHLGQDTQVLSLFGTNGWGEEHTEAVVQLRQLQEVILFFDGDEAGKKAIETYAPLVKAIMKSKITISNVHTPQGEDINSIAQNHPGEEKEVLRHLIDGRAFISRGKHADVSFSIEKSTENKNDSGDEESESVVTLDTSNPEYLRLTYNQLKMTIIGGVSLYPLDRMKVTLKISKSGSSRPMHQLRQHLDLYQDDVLEKLARKVAERLELGSSKVHESLLYLTEQVEQYRMAQMEHKEVKEPKKYTPTAQQIKAAETFLAQPNLLECTNEAIGKSGVVGEENNRLLMYLVFTSRLREQPLHIVSLGGSGTGKTYLQEKVAELIPPDEKLEITAISENALYYFDRKELKNKLVLIEDLDGANDDKVLFAIRELQSKRRISKTIPIKDSKGNLKTITLQVEGPISLAGTTTRERLYEDNANRSLLIYLDTSQKQKDAIMDYQRAISAGKINREAELHARNTLRDVQRILKPIKVINPYAEMLRIPATVFKPLRTNSHYLHFIETVTFYHQRQRPVRTSSQSGQPYIETTIEDIEAANKLLKDVLLAKSDELSKACRRFLGVIRNYLRQENRQSFYSKELRLKYRIAPSTLNRRLYELNRYGYLKIVSGNRARGFEYELENLDGISRLEADLTSAFEQALDQIKATMSQTVQTESKMSSPVAQS